MDIEDTLDSMTTDITNIEIMSSDTEAILLDMKDALDDLDYDAMRVVVSSTFKYFELLFYFKGLICYDIHISLFLNNFDVMCVIMIFLSK